MRKSSVKERLLNCVKKQLNSVLCLLFLNWSLQYEYKQVPASASWSKIATFVAVVQEWSPHALLVLILVVDDQSPTPIIFLPAIKVICT